MPVSAVKERGPGDGGWLVKPALRQTAPTSIRCLGGAVQPPPGSVRHKISRYTLGMPSKSGPVTPAQLRAAALGTLKAQPDVQTALDEMGFVQADPIRAPARAQDLTLMQRVPDYRAGDLERHYPVLDVEEDMLPNYGFVSRAVYRLLHPRAQPELRIERDAPGLGEQVLAYAQTHGEVHPKSLQQVFGNTRVGNAWGGSSNAATRSLEGLHRRGLLRVVRREKGVKVYGPARPHAGQPDVRTYQAPHAAQRPGAGRRDRAAPGAALRPVAENQPGVSALAFRLRRARSPGRAAPGTG